MMEHWKNVENRNRPNGQSNIFLDWFNPKTRINPENINKPDTILIIYGATSQVDQPLSTRAVSEKSNV